MRSQKQLKDELRFVTEFNTLFDVVQQTAMAQMRHLEDKTSQMRQLEQAIAQDFFPLLPQSAMAHPYLSAGRQGTLLVVITSDEGLVGPLHSNVVEEALRRAEKPATWLFIGQRGWRMAGNQADIGNAQVLPMPPEERIEEQLLRVKQFILTQHRKNLWKQVWLVAPQFISMTRQEVLTKQLLPLPAGTIRITDERLLIEPALKPVIERLAESWIETLLRESFWSARRAECAARTLHVEASRIELSRHSKKVRHEFFKTLHERVDRMVRETCVVRQHVSARKLGALR